MNDRCTCITKAMHKYQNKLIHIRVNTSLIVYQYSQGIVYLFANHLVNRNLCRTDIHVRAKYFKNSQLSVQSL